MDRFGRKQTLIWIGVLYFVSALWSGLAAGALSLTIARLIGGVGVGIATVASPLSISEIAPPLYRGRLAGLFQFNIVLGILVAFVSNALIGGTGPNDWRWMLGVEAIPALAYTLLCVTLPESPRWLIWVFISEIFPSRHRAAGQSLGSFTHWMAAALLTAFFPAMVTAFPPALVFLFFCLMMVLQLVWVKAMVPETRGRPLEQIGHDLGLAESVPASWNKL